MSKKKVVIISGSIIVFLAALVAAYFIFFKPASTPTTSEDQLSTTRVRTGDLIISASGAGTVITNSDLQIGFSSSGVLEATYVKVGDVVKAGQELAKLENDPQLNLTLASEKIAVLTAQQNLTDLETSWESDLANAKIQYLTAKDDLKTLKVERTALNYKRCVDTTIENLEADYYAAKNDYEMKVDLYNSKFLMRDAEDLGKQEMEATVANAKVAFDKANANWQYCLQKPSQDEIDLADVNVLVKEAEMNSWQAKITKMQDGPDQDQLNLLQAKLTQAQDQLEIAQANVDGLVLTAPIGGTVMSINGLIGTTVSGSSFIRLADLSTPVIEVYMDESDLDSIVVGYETDVTFDAFADQVFKGTVTYVSPELVSSGNVKYVYGLVSLDMSSFAKPFNLPLGMNATVEVIGGRAEGVLLVPVEALKTIDEGQYGVFVMENGVPKLKVVEVGLMDFTSAEIKSGLNLGDEVTTGIVETVQ